MIIAATVIHGNTVFCTFVRCRRIYGLRPLMTKAVNANNFGTSTDSAALIERFALNRPSEITDFLMAAHLLLCEIR